MAEQLATVGEVTVCFEEFGDRGDPTVLLVMGLATQMIAWHEDFCAALAARGFHVVRYDNRDVGRSSRMSGAPPSAWQMLVRDPRAARYSLEDMAADGIGVLDHLGVARAHVVGASMGGMIAQVMAARHPDRVLSLVSIMSSTGHRWSGQPALRLLPVFLRRAPAEREAWIEHVVKTFELIGSPGFPRDDAGLRDMVTRSYDRGHDAAGPGRQLAAILAAGDRSADVATIHVPTLVVHGGADKLVALSGARRTASLIPGARLLIIDGMGHDLPRGAWPRILDGIVETARRAGTPAPAAG